MATHYIGITNYGALVSRKSTRSDFTHAAAIGLDGKSSRLPSFGTSAEGARRNFFTNHHDSAPVCVVPVHVVDAATYRAALANRNDPAIIRSLVNDAAA